MLKKLASILALLFFLLFLTFASSLALPYLTQFFHKQTFKCPQPPQQLFFPSPQKTKACFLNSPLCFKFRKCHEPPFLWQKQTSYPNKKSLDGDITMSHSTSNQYQKYLIGVKIDPPFQSEGVLTPQQVQTQRQAIKDSVDQVISDIGHDNFQNLTRYQYIPRFAASVDSSTLEALEKHPLVTGLSKNISYPVPDVDFEAPKNPQTNKLKELLTQFIVKLSFKFEQLFL